MAKSRASSKPSWKDVKAKLSDIDRLGLLGLVQDLYAANKDNQTFLHARFGLGEDVLEPYKEVLSRWLWPDVMRNQDVSVAKAKQAVASYRKAVGDPAGLAELMVYYCEAAAGFAADVGYEGDSYFNGLLEMYDGAIGLLREIGEGQRKVLLARLDRVRVVTHSFGYWVGDAMDDLMAQIPED